MQGTVMLVQALFQGYLSPAVFPILNGNTYFYIEKEVLKENSIMKSFGDVFPCFRSVDLFGIKVC